MDLASPTIHKTGNNQYAVTYGEDNNLYVEFENVAVFQEAESEKEGRAIYKEVPHVKILFPGDRTKSVCRPIKENNDSSGPSDAERFPRQWTAFLAQQEQTAEGTPLTEWAMITKSQALELKSLHIHTVDALAILPDDRLQKMGIGARDLREKAKTWLDMANGGSQVSQLVNENKILKDDMALLKQQLAELSALYDKDEQPRRGRPKAA